ncbi:MAG: tRNA 2-selenouridine(34) synthase MnmH [Gudongella sp.]|nr:tRNA 2-selenouridine(34) synthase MnmH [Gudongella sp.]
MYPNISYEELKEKMKPGEYIVIDVRTPNEFKNETIPGAINIPIFSNEERAQIGIEYVNNSTDEAKLIGIEAISKNLPDIFKQILELKSIYPYLIFFCSRGGFRSSSIVALLDSLKLSALKLQGGYKAYRAYINSNLEKISKDVALIVLYGNTGTGKTQILKALKEKGAETLDLEACANHRGSTLGSVGLGNPNSQKMFESLLFDAISNRKSDLIFTEGESKRIGKSVIPEYLFEKIINGKHIEVTAPMENRVKNIRLDYLYESDKDLIEALNHLRKRLGNSTIDEYINSVKSGHYNPVIENLMLNYYDPMYEHNKKNYIYSIENLDPELSADILIEKFSKKENSI